MKIWHYIAGQNDADEYVHYEIKHIAADELADYLDSRLAKLNKVRFLRAYEIKEGQLKPDFFHCIATCKRPFD